MPSRSATLARFWLREIDRGSRGRPAHLSLGCVNAEGAPGIGKDAK